MVLLVDDFEDSRAMYGDYLGFHGFRIEEARNGKEAIEKATELLPDAILMDLSMPIVDGWEATRRLKADSRTRHIPIMALTGHALSGYAESARKAGCDAVVTKPCLPADLMEEVRRLLDTNNRRKAKRD